MKTFFEDEFINKKILSRLVREVRKEQLTKTINEIDYLNELQHHLLCRDDLMHKPEQIVGQNAKSAIF